MVFIRNIKIEITTIFYPKSKSKKRVYRKNVLKYLIIYLSKNNYYFWADSQNIDIFKN